MTEMKQNNLAAMILVRNHLYRVKVVLFNFETQYFNGGHKNRVLGKNNYYEPQCL